MEAISITDSEFLEPLNKALGQGHELLVLHMPPQPVVTRHWFLVNRPEQLTKVLSTGKLRSWFSVFLEPELCLRGIAGDALQDTAVQLLLELGEILLARIVPNHLLLDDVRGTESLDDIEEWFSYNWGYDVAFGRYPPFWLPNGPEVLTAFVTDEKVLTHATSPLKAKKYQLPG